MDLHEKLQKTLEEYQKKDPDKSFQWIDSAPDVLRDRVNVDGFQVVKEGDQSKAGVAGEVRVGDLILAARPRKEAIEERERLKRKTRQRIESPALEFEAALEKSGAGGKYLKPMSSDEIARDRGTRYKGGNKE